jgi:hypothetical protein
MLVCGIELTANEAIICLLSHNMGVFNVPDCRSRSFILPKSADTDAVRQFHFSFSKLMEDYHVDEIVIIERPQKGKLAGSAVSFKLETAIQLQSLPATLINHTEIKAQLKRNKIQADFESLELKKFQKAAFNAAYAYQSHILYGHDEK